MEYEAIVDVLLQALKVISAYVALQSIGVTIELSVVSLSM